MISNLQKWDQKSPWLKSVAWGLALTLLALIAYGPALRGSLVWDDDSWTTLLRPTLSTWGGLWDIWAHPTTLQQYYPLTGTTFWLDHHFWGEWTTPYHVENVLLHLFGALLLVRLLKQLQCPGATFAGLLFIFHPVMVESVAWITERKNVLSMPLFLAALLAYGRFTYGWSVEPGKPDRSTWRWYGLSLGLFLAAMLAKITALALPPVLLIVLWWKRGRLTWKGEIQPTIPFFILSAILGLIVRWVELHHVGAEGPDFALSFPARLIVAGRALWFYPQQLLWPQFLCFVYPQWTVDPADILQWLWPVTAVAAYVAAWFARRRLGRAPLAIMVYYGVTLFPVLGLMNAYGMRYSFVWDHWTYLSSIGIFAAVAALGAQLARRWLTPGQAAFTGLVVIGLLGFRTWKESATYQSMEKLWLTTLDRNPNCWMAWQNLGAYCISAGRKQEAITCINQALKIKPVYPEARNDLGLIYQHEGRLDEAIAQYQIALADRPDFAMARLNLANVYLMAHQYTKAQENYEKVLDANAELPGAELNLAHALMGEGKLEDAIQHYRIALRLNPRDALANYNMGAALLQRGQAQEAISYFESAISDKAQFPEAERSLGNAQFQLGHATEALQHYEKAAALRPKDADLQHDVGMLLMQTQSYAEAIAFFNRALQIQPRDAETEEQVATAFLKLGQPGDAMTHFEAALRLQPTLPNSLNMLAWVLATCPDAGMRNGPKAVALATQANQASGGKNPAQLATLAAAYAEAGQFAEAQQTAQHAIDLATQQGQTAQAAVIRGHLKFYQYNAPLRDRQMGGVAK